VEEEVLVQHQVQQQLYLMDHHCKLHVTVVVLADPQFLAMQVLLEIMVEIVLLVLLHHQEQVMVDIQEVRIHFLLHLFILVVVELELALMEIQVLLLQVMVFK
jgi:hypothetical protein